MDHQAKTPLDQGVGKPAEAPEERASRVAEIKRLVAAGRYRVDGREILYNMIKTAP